MADNGTFWGIFQTKTFFWTAPYWQVLLFSGGLNFAIDEPISGLTTVVTATALLWGPCWNPANPRNKFLSKIWNFNKLVLKWLFFFKWLFGHVIRLVPFDGIVCTWQTNSRAYYITRGNILLIPAYLALIHGCCQLECPLVCCRVFFKLRLGWVCQIHG